jgi:hypothetical protein
METRRSALQSLGSIAESGERPLPHGLAIWCDIRSLCASHYGWAGVSHRGAVRANTAYAVAASLMNLPTSVAGSRFLLSDDADQAPVAGS